MRSVLPYLLFAGLLLVCAIKPVAAQEQKGPASELAEQAYKDLAIKKYADAINNFNKALAQDPSNSSWRKDLGYAYLAAGLSQDALREFSTVYHADHTELGIALQLGYLSEQLHEYDAAEKYFHEAAASDDDNISSPARLGLTHLEATRRQARKQQAYDLLFKNRRVEAIRLFEQVHDSDPSDVQTTLQLGYLYFADHDNRRAREMFMSVRRNQNREIAARAETALDEISKESKWWFGNIYAAPTYQSRFSNQINVLDVKIGLRPSPYFEPYAGLRVSRDVRSKAGRLPEIYSDNSAILAFGVQSRFASIGATLYGEAGTALSLLSHSQSRSVPDYRAGINWFHGWGKPLAAVAQENSSRFSLTGSGYSDVSYYTRYDHNVIGYGQLRQGVNLPGSRFFPVQVLAAANFVKDGNKDFYNNVAEGGPIVRIAPLYHVLGIQLEGQYLYGYYTRRDSSNPYPANYRDARVLLTWSASF